jgi:adenosine kinase
MRILVSGSLAYDRIMTFPGRFSDHILPDKIHILNVCFLVNGLTEKFGGTAGNIAYSLKLLGENPVILSSAGKDFAAYADWLAVRGLSFEGIRRIEEEFTAGAYITTDQSDNQITGFNPGAMKHPCGFDVDGLDPDRSLAIVGPGKPGRHARLPGATKSAASHSSSIRGRTSRPFLARVTEMLTARRTSFPTIMNSN